MSAGNRSQASGNAFISSLEDAASQDAAFFTPSGNAADIVHSRCNFPSAVLHLRPHHLLCLQTFTGRGYSEEFVRHMTLVKRQLTRDPRTAIELVSGVDDLCAHCPNNVDGQCTSDNPALFDSKVSRKLYSTGIISPDAASKDHPGKRPVLTGIPDALEISSSVLEECCPGCEWKELCLSIAGKSG